MVAPLTRYARLPLLAWIAACTYPALAAVAAGRGGIGAQGFFGLLCALLLYYSLKRDRFAVACLAIGTVPVMMLLRDAFSYSSVLVLLASSIGIWIVICPADLYRLKRNHLLVFFTTVTLIYWGASAVVTGSPFSNMRILELVLAVINVVLLGTSRLNLATALLGIGVSGSAIGLGLMGHGGRLGSTVVDGIVLGNPISFGLPMALVLILTVADGGLWLFLSGKRKHVMVASAVAGVFLLLSTSRGSWLVAMAAFGTLFVLSRPSRSHLLGVLGVLTLVLLGVLATGSGDNIAHYFEKATSSDRTLDQKTSGRAEQWVAFPFAMAESPLWGSGPASGPIVALKYTGVARAWHSLYLHVGIETGLIGLTCLAIVLYGLIRMALKYRRVCGQVTPLLGVVGFMTTGLTVSGFDAISGVYLGLAFLAYDTSNIFRLRRVVFTYELPEDESSYAHQAGGDDDSGGRRTRSRLPAARLGR